MRNRKAIIQSLFIAAVIGFVFPIVLVAALGTTSKTPVVKKSHFDGWSQEQIQKYVQTNSVQVPFSEHAISTLKGVMKDPIKYFEASAYIFLFVFAVNWIIVGRKKNAP